MNPITITQEALDIILEESKGSKWEGLETGGFLFGEITEERRVVLHATKPGPDATRTPAFFEPDYGSSALEYVKLKETHENLKYVGIWHLHCVDGLSGGDVDTLKRMNESFPGILSLVVNNRTMDIRVFSIKDEEVIERELEKADEIKKESVNSSESDTDSLNFSRTQELVDPKVIKDKTVLVFGLGSGGSSNCHYLARLGIGRMTLADNETVEDVNLPRHTAYHKHVGQKKTDVLAVQLKSINPDIEVVKVDEKLTADTQELFKEFIEQADLVMASSGNILANRLITDMCLELETPVVYAGMYQKGMGGFSFLGTGNKKDPCFNCVFEHAGALDDTNEERDQAAKRYGLTCEELAAETGLYVDISFVSLLQTKMALLTLMDGHSSPLPKLPGNFVAWDTKTLATTWTTIQKRDDCPVCNPEGFLESMGGEGMKAIDVTRIPVLSKPFESVASKHEPTEEVSP